VHYADIEKNNFYLLTERFALIAKNLKNGHILKYAEVEHYIIYMQSL